MALIKKDLLSAVQQFADKKAVIFDMDGLIFDTERLFMEQLAVVMKDYGYQLTREIYSQTLGTCGELLEKLMQSHYGLDYPIEKISQEADRRVRIVAETVGLTLKPQIVEVLEYLQKEGIPCAVASSTRSDKVVYYLEKTGIRHCFKEIVGGEMVEKSKPEPDIFLKASERLGIKAEESVVLEDSENGVRAAHAAGCDVICVPDLKMPSEDVLEYVNVVVIR